MRVKVLCILVLMLVAVGPCLCNTWYVACGGSGDGTSWATPLGTITAALNAASSGDSVHVLGYTDSTVYNQLVTLKDGVSIYGGYYGTSDQRDTSTYITTISATGKSDCAVYVPSTVTSTSSTILDGVKITEGIGRLATYRYGGGIYCLGSPTIQNCNITGNSAMYGAGIYAASGTSPSIHDNKITYNTGAGSTSGGDSGVGVYMYSGECSYNEISHNSFQTSGYAHYGAGLYIGAYASPTIKGNNISYNGNSSRTGSNGGGIYASNCDSGSVVSDNTISYNYASIGGGIRWASPGTVKGNAISHNSYNGSSSYGTGGGVYLDSSGALENNTISNNAASSGGGVYYAGGGAVSRNVIDSNSSASGGGIYWISILNAGAIYSNVISSNTASTNGSGVYVSTMQSASKFVNNTVVGHTNGSGIYLYNPASGCTIANCIIKSNASYGVTLSGTGSCSLVHCCFFGNGTDTSGNVSKDSHCLNATDPISDSNYHIASNSPCIDAGDDSRVGSGWKDIDAQPRQANIPDRYDSDYDPNDTVKVDIGADEYYPDLITTPVVNRGLPSPDLGSALNDAAGANRCNFRWADASSLSTCYGDDFNLYDGPTWVIDKIVVWTVPDVPMSPAYNLSDYYSDVTLYLSNGQTGALAAVKSAAFSGNGTDNPDVTVSPAYYGTSTNYQCSDGIYNQIWRIEFSKLAWAIPANSTVYFGVTGTPKVDRLWFNHATYNLADGVLRKIDTTDLSGTSAVSSASWFGKSADINVQVYAHPQ